MKSKYLAVALSAVALVACNNEEVLEVNQGRGISFQVATEASTRATATTTTSIDNFKVWGFTESNEILMPGIDVTGNNTDGWTYGDAIFWPNAGTVDFYAMTPTECGGTVSVAPGTGKQTITNFKVNTDVTKQVDLLYALNTDEKKEDHKEGATPVKLNFRHALSQIVFKAKNINEHLSVDIKGVRVAKVFTGGNFAFPTLETTTQLTTTPGNTDTETDESWGKWTLNTEKGFYAAGIKETTNIIDNEETMDLTDTNGALMLMPQTIKGWDINGNNEGNGATNRGAYFLVNCKIYNVSGENNENKVLLWPTTEEYREVAIPIADITWKQGKKYIYTFIFGEGGGYEPPIDPTDPTDPDPDPENPGDPVLVPVTFTVTVDDFQSGDAQDIEMIEKDNQ